MRASVVKSADFGITPARKDQIAATDTTRQVIIVLRQLAVVAEIKPALGKYFFFLQREHFRAAIGIAMDAENTRIGIAHHDLRSVKPCLG